MSSLQEKLKRTEHIAVASKHIGLTIALIGVLIAFCAAMVGSEQNQLTRTMTEQTQANSDYTGASTKFRIVMVELEKLRHESSLGSTEAGPNLELKRFCGSLWITAGSATLPKHGRTRISQRLKRTSTQPKAMTTRSSSRKLEL